MGKAMPLHLCVCCILRMMFVNTLAILLEAHLNILLLTDQSTISHWDASVPDISKDVTWTTLLSPSPFRNYTRLLAHDLV